MGLFRPILVAVVGLALASHAFDCFAAANTEQAMQCCNSMHCSSHAHHGQDCCKRMPSVRSPFVQPSSVHGVSFSPTLLAVMPARGELPVLGLLGTHHTSAFPRSAALLVFCFGTSSNLA